MGDTIIIHIDSFYINTIQNSYEILCAVNACFDIILILIENVEKEKTVFCSDAEVGTKLYMVA